MTRRLAVLLAAAGSAGLLLGALAFQYLGGLAPCQMCLWQRWPHLAAILIAGLTLALPGWLWPWLGALAAASSGAIGLFHAGVERGWWEGLTACAGGQDIGALTPEELLAQIMEAPLVRCDEIAWQMLGLSMAGWNAVISFVLAGLWIYAATRPRDVT
ncbi:MAG: disulfide bond formation protein B [Pseudomonadota bacterium]